MMVSVVVQEPYVQTVWMPSSGLVALGTRVNLQPSVYSPFVSQPDLPPEDVLAILVNDDYEITGVLDDLYKLITVYDTEPDEITE